MANSWFSRTGSGNPTTPSTYVKQTSVPSCSSGTNQICAIFAEVDGSSLPIFTIPLRDEMVLALDSRSSTTNVKLRL